MNAAVSPIIRFAEHLPKSGDIELSLIKAHLLIEEALTSIILKAARHPKYIKRARLTFSTKISLARSFCDLEDDPWLWSALTKLNDARNELVHGLSNQNMRIKLDEFVRFVEAEQGTPDNSLLLGAFAPFHWAASKLFTILSLQADFDPTDMTINADAIAGIEENAEP
jgi:hypothetical protein